MHYGRMRSAPGWQCRRAALAGCLATGRRPRVVRGQSVSCARDMDVTMTSQLLMLMMLTSLTSCQDQQDYNYPIENSG